MAAHQRAGVGVDVNHLAVAPDAGVLLVGLIDAASRVAAGFERVKYGQREGLLHLEHIGQILMMKARCVDGLLDVEAACPRPTGRCLATVVMMARAAAASRARSSSLPSFRTMVGVIELRAGACRGRWRWPGPGSGRTYWQHPSSRQVVHLVVEQKAKRAGGDV